MYRPLKNGAFAVQGIGMGTRRLYIAFTGGTGGGGYGGGGGDRMSNLGGTLRNQDWSSVKLTAFEKNFYVEDKAVAQRSDREIEDFRREKEIRVRKARVFRTFLTNISLRSNRYRDVTFHDPSVRSRRLVSLNTCLRPSAPKVSRHPVPFSVKLGPWL